MNDKTVLVTGANGFVGHHFVDHILKNTNWNIIAMINRSSYRIDSSEIFSRNKDRVRIISFDLSDPYEYPNDIENVDYIVNFASLSHVDDSINNPIYFTHSNINIMLSVINMAMKLKPLKFIHFSTDEIYGPVTNGDLHKEWSPIIPANPYSGSKAAQESILISFWRTYRIPAIIINTMTLFGERQGSERYVPKIIRNILDDKKIQIHTKNGIPGTRSYLHARNSADALLFILNNVEPAMYPDFYLPERFNVVGDAYLNNLELAQAIGKSMDKEVVYEFVEMSKVRPGQDLKYGIDGTKLYDLGYRYPVTFKDSLNKSISWMIDEKNREFLYL